MSVDYDNENIYHLTGKETESTDASILFLSELNIRNSVRSSLNAIDRVQLMHK